MATYEINYKSDFTLVMGFTLAGVAVPLPVGNFRIVFRTQEYGTEYECSRINGEYVNCQDNGNDTLLCIFDRHGLRPGALRGEVFDYIPDTTFPDGSQLVVTPSLFDIELVEGAGNTSEGVTAEVVISVEEVIGDARDAALAAENAAESANAAADAAAQAIAGLDDRLAAKQDTLVSGENIKTINNLSLLGSGNIDIQGGGDNVFIVTFRVSGSTTIADKTAQEIADAALGGKLVAGVMSNVESAPSLLLSGHDLVESDEIVFTGIKSNWILTLRWALTDDYTYTATEMIVADRSTLASVATSGSYNDLSNKPTIPAAQVNADWDAASGVAAILNKPTIPDLATYCPIIEDTRSSSVAAITGTAPFSSLTDGQRIVLHFKYRNEASPTLQLTLSDGTTTAAIPLYQNYNSGVGTLTVQAMPAGSYGEFVYDQTNSRWMLLGKDVNTTYANTSQADINNAAQGSRLIEPKLLVDNFVKLRKYVDNSSDASVELAVNTYNDLGTLSTWKPVTLPATYDRADEFVFRFTCNDASLTPTLPQGVVMADNFEWSEMAMGVVFQVSIFDGEAAYLVLTPQNP